MKNEKTMNTKEVAKFLKVSENYVRSSRYFRNNKKIKKKYGLALLPFYKAGFSVFYKAKDVEAYKRVTKR